MAIFQITQAIEKSNKDLLQAIKDVPILANNLQPFVIANQATLAAIKEVHSAKTHSAARFEKLKKVSQRVMAALEGE